MGPDPGMRLVTLGFGCEGHATISHEIMHRLGFWHEQSRYILCLLVMHCVANFKYCAILNILDTIEMILLIFFMKTLGITWNIILINTIIKRFVFIIYTKIKFTYRRIIYCAI